MKLKEFKNKFILYDENGRVVVITRERKIALKFAKEKNGTINSKLHRSTKDST